MVEIAESWVTVLLTTDLAGRADVVAIVRWCEAKDCSLRKARMGKGQQMQPWPIVVGHRRSVELYVAAKAGITIDRAAKAWVVQLNE